MNLFEMLENYKTSPKNEIRKLFAILNRTYGYTKFWDALNGCYLKSELCAVEPSLDDFYSNFIFNNPLYSDLDNFEEETLHYRLLVELLLELLKFDIPGFEYGEFDKEENQLRSIINEGLQKMGYGLMDYKGKEVTYKRDIVAETIAVENKKYKEDIFDYLISKTCDEKEMALTNLSIKLQALTPKDSFMRNARDYVQMLRHKDEREEDKLYSWFFEKEVYEKNLDDLFRILICYAAHSNCSNIISDYDSKCHIKK